MVRPPTLLFVSFLLGASTIPRGRADTAEPRPSIEWDPASINCLQENANYGRMTRLADGAVLCCFEHDHKAWVMRSEDDAAAWSPPVEVASFPAGKAANPELCPLDDGQVLLFWNDRPRTEGGEARYQIRMSRSCDGGRTWTHHENPLYIAGNTARSGCWEPAAIEKDDTVHLLFSQEKDITNGQQITRMASRDQGGTWTAPQRAAFRPGHRDGMPVPVILKDGRCLFSIEDSGLVPPTGNKRSFRPTIVNLMTGSRWPAINVPLLPHANLAAPYLAVSETGETVLSVQFDNKSSRYRRMAVYIGNAEARNFAGRSFPFGDKTGRDQLWNSLFVLDANRILAITHTSIGGRRGLWTITGTFKPPTRSPGI